MFQEELLSNLKRALIFIATPLIVFTSARNTITWHCQQFWGASADFWQHQWDKVLAVTGEDPFTLWFYGTLVLPFIVFWVLGSFYTFLDLTNTPLGLMRYKMQPGINEPVESKRLLKVLPNVLLNTTLFSVPAAYLNYIVMEWRGYSNLRQLPTFHWVILELAVFIILEEIGFYYAHRILHCNVLYKYIHKQHHEWTSPIALMSLYCHPVEQIFSNTLPMCLGLYVMGSHVATAYLWFAMGMFSTLHSHCGYHLPFIPSPEFHDYHHLKFTNCFGVLGIMDRLHGTDIKFRESIQNARHTINLNLISPREMHPDPVPKHLQKK